MVGTSEVLASVTQIEFFYDQAPDSMRSIMLSVQLLCVGLGGYLSSALVWIVDLVTTYFDSMWLTDDLNEGHLDYYYLLLGSIMAFVYFLFLIDAYKYKYKEIKHEHVEQEENITL